MTLAWHVVRSKPNHEDFLARELESREIEVFYPLLRANPVNPRARRFKPYFPGYIFVHVDLALINSTALERVPGAANLVSFGGEVASVPDHLVQAIRRKVDETNAAGGEKQAEIQPGDIVEIDYGPFAGYTAILDASLPGSERVRVLLRMLEKRELPVEMPLNYIRVRRSPRNRAR
jgi:transcriptional antiterminator RfaH